MFPNFIVLVGFSQCFYDASTTRVDSELGLHIENDAAESQQRGTTASRAAFEGQLAHVKSDLVQLFVTEQEIENARAEISLREALGTTSFLPPVDSIRQDAGQDSIHQDAGQDSIPGSEIPESSVHIRRVPASACGGQLVKFDGAESSDELGPPLASGCNAEVWCVKAPDSGDTCPSDCVPNFVSNPACLVLRKSVVKRQYIEMLAKQTQDTINLQNFLAAEDLAPEIKEVWQCDPDDWENENVTHTAETWIAMAPALGESLKTIALRKGVAWKNPVSNLKHSYVYADKQTIASELTDECKAVITAVEKLHKTFNILHRDMHWDNIFINDGKATLIDLDTSDRIKFRLSNSMCANDMKFYLAGLCRNEAEEYLKKYA